MKRGTVVLIFSSLAFLVTSLLFLNSVVEKRNTNAYFDLVEANHNAENCLFLLDKTSKFALKDSLLEKESGETYYDLIKKNPSYLRDVDNKRNFESVFIGKFNKYNKAVNEVCGTEVVVKADEITIYTNNKDGSISIARKTENKISFSSGSVKYSVNPNFVGNVLF